MFPRRRIRVSSALAVLILSALATLLGSFLGSKSALAAGDNTLSSSNPAPSENVTVAPTQLQLVFTNPLANPNDVNQMGLSALAPPSWVPT